MSKQNSNTFGTTDYKAKFSTNGCTGDFIIMASQDGSRSGRFTCKEKNKKRLFNSNQKFTVFCLFVLLGFFFLQPLYMLDYIVRDDKIFGTTDATNALKNYKIQ